MQLIEENNESIFRQYLPAIAVFAMLISIGVFQVIKMGNSTEYQIKNSFKGTVTSKFINKSWVYVGLEGKEKKQEIKDGYNYSYEIPYLIEFIAIGDKVRKSSCSDTVYIERQGKEFHFIQLAYWYNDPTRTPEYLSLIHI